MTYEQATEFRDLKRELRNLKEEAVLACLELKSATAQIDVLMLQPESHERGKKIAAVANAIDMSKDRLWHFGLKRPLPVRYKGRKKSEGRE